MPFPTDHDFRRIALSMPHAEEKAHFGKADFRVRNKIFAGLPEIGIGVVKLTPDEQAMLAEAEPAIFSPVKGGWGQQGWTRVTIAKADETTLKSVLTMAWRNVAPASMKKAVGRT
jgi:hypothetical protein